MIVDKIAWCLSIKDRSMLIVDKVANMLKLLSKIANMLKLCDTFSNGTDRKHVGCMAKIASIVIV